MAKVVTRRGDLGSTDLKGRRVSKTSKIIKLLGALDKVNVMIGVYQDRPDLQNLLYRMSGAVAGFDVPINDMEAIEKEIASHDLNLLAKKFVRAEDPLHLIRVEIRAAEILAWEAKQNTAARLLNRLSDLYFILAEEGKFSHV